MATSKCCASCYIEFIAASNAQRYCVACSAVRPSVIWNRSYYELNKDRLKARWAVYRASNLDKIRQAAKKYVAENREAISSKGKQKCAAIRLEAVAAYGGKCVCCGESEPKFLCIHHIYGDGKTDRDMGYSGYSLFLKLRREGWPKDHYELLCHNCNEAIRLTGYCPHSRGRL